MKIIFLDIDGVLNVYPQGHDEFGATFHPHFEQNLRSVIEATDAKIVITSTWRSVGLAEMKRMWAARGLPGEVIDITPYGSVIFYLPQKVVDTEDKVECTLPRGVEIEWYLANHGYSRFFVKDNLIENYVIIDDDRDMLLQHKDNFVCCSDNVDHEDCVDVGLGFTKKNAELAIKILNSIKK